MFWESCNIEFFENKGCQFVKVSGNEVLTNKLYWVYISEKQFDRICRGESINTCIENPETKHFLVAGIAPMVDSGLNFKRKIKQSVYVTNAVSNSVAYYAMTFLNNCGMSSEELNIIRKGCNLPPSISGKFNVKELQNQFVKQSIFFLRLYLRINKDFDNYITSLSDDERYDIYKITDTKLIRKMFRRFIYHNRLECDLMRSDYEDNAHFYCNTGVFSEKYLLEGKMHTYCLDELYLKKLGMTLCKKCSYSAT